MYCPEPSEREPNNHPLPALTAEALSSFLLERVNAHDSRDIDSWQVEFERTYVAQDYRQWISTLWIQNKF
jgi:hypothetical protein